MVPSQRCRDVGDVWKWIGKEHGLLVIDYVQLCLEAAGCWHWSTVAAAYQMADAMLAARKPKEE